MPLLKLETNVALSDEKKKLLLPALSKIVAETLGKPESYVMVTINPTAILMSGKADDAAFVDVRSIWGLSLAVNQQLSRNICTLLRESLGLAPNCVYLNFFNIDATNWGWKGSTFG
jgi:phenylpyruvate tautomerase PptA (4-oxalocrotonate tautomerase family)